MHCYCASLKTGGKARTGGTAAAEGGGNIANEAAQVQERCNTRGIHHAVKLFKEKLTGHSQRQIGRVVLALRSPRQLEVENFQVAVLRAGGDERLGEKRKVGFGVGELEQVLLVCETGPPPQVQLWYR